MPAISRSMTALLIAAAASAAVLSHYVIDVVADYLVPHASFDDVASHGSRGAIGAIAVAAAFALALRGLRLCCDAAAGRGSLATVRPSWRSAIPFIVGTVVLACVAVPAMEVADARWGGAPIDGLDDAFGGSTLLGVATTAICGLFVAGAMFGFVRWLLSHRDRIVAAIASEIRRAYASIPNPQLLRRLRSVASTTPRIVAFRRGKRAPPRGALENFALSSRASRGDSCYTCSLRRVALSWATSTRHRARRSRALTSSPTVRRMPRRRPTPAAIFR